MLTASEIREKIDWLRAQNAAEMDQRLPWNCSLEQSANGNRASAKEDTAAETRLRNKVPRKGGEIVSPSCSIPSRAA